MSCFLGAGDAQIHNSYNATRVMFNLDMKEVTEYIKRYIDIVPIFL